MSGHRQNFINTLLRGRSGLVAARFTPVIISRATAVFQPILGDINPGELKDDDCIVVQHAKRRYSL